MLPVNREDWLTQASAYITAWYKLKGFDAKYVQASCGWPINDPKNCAGEVWLPELAADGQWYVHVSPILSDTISVLGVLAHEVAHTIDMSVNHSGVFVKAVRAIGLVPPVRDSIVGARFDGLAALIIDHLGQYPFKGLKPKWRKVRQRLVLVYTCTGCGYTAMIPRKYRDAASPRCGVSHCSIYGRPMQFNKEEERV